MTLQNQLIFHESKYEDLQNSSYFFQESGKICKSVGMSFEGYLPGAALGSLVRIRSNNHEYVDAEVIGFRDKRAILMPLDEARGINTQSRIEPLQREPKIDVGMFLLGRVIDAKGQPIDNKGPLYTSAMVKSKQVFRTGIYNQPKNPMQRKLISTPLDLGLRSLNGLLTVGMGQRIGIMAGSGVGKSTLLGMMARNTMADINVIALIGERGREVREFIEKDLGPEGLARSILVVATSEKSPLLRIRGAYVATAISEYFAKLGANVLLMMDSITRFSMAQREIGLSMGEPPASKGYTPSVFAALPKLLERAGTWEGEGSVTGIYTVLVDGDDMDEPIADAARSILDGHVVLSRNLANQNHYPPIDVGSSISRCMSSVVGSDHMRVANEFRDLMAVYQSNEDLINIGAYVKGSNQKLDQAVSVMERIKNFLKQRSNESANIDQTVAQMKSILAMAGIRV